MMGIGPFWETVVIACFDLAESKKQENNDAESLEFETREKPMGQSANGKAYGLTPRNDLAQEKTSHLKGLATSEEHAIIGACLCSHSCRIFIHLIRFS
jgi:hypothetical protein